MRLAPAIIFLFLFLIATLLYSLFFSESGIQERDLILQRNNELLEENQKLIEENRKLSQSCLLYTSPSPRDGLLSRMPSSA